WPSSASACAAHGGGGRLRALNQVGEFRIEHRGEHHLQLGGHDLEFVGDVQDVDGRELHAFETRGDPHLVLAFHHENDVGPAQVGCGDAAFRVGANAGGAHVEAGVVAVEAFDGHAAPLVFGADKQDFQAAVHEGCGDVGPGSRAV